MLTGWLRRGETPGKQYNCIITKYSSELTNLSISSSPLTQISTQEHGPEHGVDADQAERDARELTTAFQHALSNNNANVDENAMDVDSDMNKGEGEDEDDEKDDDDDGVVFVDPQAQSAKEWVCFCTYDTYNAYAT